MEQTICFQCEQQKEIYGGVLCRDCYEYQIKISMVIDGKEDN